MEVGIEGGGMWFMFLCIGSLELIRGAKGD